MSRPVGMMCAAALLVAAGGCSLGSFLVSFTGAGGRQQVVAGSVDQVSGQLQAALGNAGFTVTSSRDGQDVRLAVVTRKGKKFDLVLTGQKTEAGESTRVAVRWDKEADEESWGAVVQMLTAPPPPPTTGFPDAGFGGPK